MARLAPEIRAYARQLQREEEAEDINAFIDAYPRATGETLELVDTQRIPERNPACGRTEVLSGWSTRAFGARPTRLAGIRSSSSGMTWTSGSRSMTSRPKSSKSLSCAANTSLTAAFCSHGGRHADLAR